MGNSHKVSTFFQPLQIALAAAIVLHLFLLLVKFNLGSAVSKPLEQVITVSLLSQKQTEAQDEVIELTHQKNDIQFEPKQVTTEKKPQSEVKAVLVNDKTVITKVAEDNQERSQSKEIFVGSVDIKAWANRDAVKFMSEHNSAELSVLRKGSIEERLLNPNRKDQRTSLSSDKIATSDGDIHAQKIAGKTVCRLDVNAEAGFNDLALAPLSGKAMGFACGDTKTENDFIDDKGRIKNSDFDEWTIND